MVFYKIQLSDGKRIITNINANSKVKSVYTNMQEIDAETIKKYKLKRGMYRKDVRRIDKNILDCAKDVDMHTEIYVNIESLKDDCLYFESGFNKIYDKRDVDIWSADYILYLNGSKVKLALIIDEVKVHAEKTNTEYRDNCTIYSYKTDKGTIKVESYPDAFDTVVEGKNILGF